MLVFTLASSYLPVRPPAGRVAAGRARAGCRSAPCRAAPPNAMHAAALDVTPRVMEVNLPAFLPSAPKVEEVEAVEPPPSTSGGDDRVVMRLINTVAMMFQSFSSVTSVLFVLAVLGKLPFHMSTALLAWFFLEAIHHVGSKLAARLPSPTAPQMQPKERLTFWRACLNDPTQSVEDFITGWFIKKGGKRVVLSDLRRDNVVAWVAW